MKKLLDTNEGTNDRLSVPMNNSATKDDLKKLATRRELKQVEKNLRGEILRVEERLENLEGGQKRIETKVDRVLDTLDSFVGRLDTLETENEIGSHQIRQLDVRVTKLESSSKP